MEYEYYICDCAKIHTFKENNNNNNNKTTLNVQLTPPSLGGHFKKNHIVQI